VDGSPVAATISNGATTTVTYNLASSFVNNKHSGQLIWGENTTPQTMHTNAFSFQVRLQTPADLPPYTAGTFWIEAEDFDSTGTPVPAAVDAMPYDLGLYGGTADYGPYEAIGATLNVDYFNNDTRDNLNNANNTNVFYRSVGDPNISGRSVDLAVDNGANFGLARPGFDMTQNYKIGWGDSADWYNYTRKIPPGLYTAYVALSDGNGPLGNPHAMGGTLSLVTAGVGTATQTLKTLGTFDGPSSGAWSFNNLVPMYAVDGSPAVFKLTSATSTLRYWNRAGDYDWFALVKVANSPPKLASASPTNNATGATSALPRDGVRIQATIEDFSTAVVQSSVKLVLDGVDVTSSATITKPADITTVSYNPSLVAGGSHTYQIIFTDNGTPALTQTNSISFAASSVMGSPGMFLIEAEDFNHDGGQTVAAASQMPYLGGAYRNLHAILGVDYNDNDNPADNAFPYRPSLTNQVSGTNVNVNMDAQLDAGSLDVVRGATWTMTANYKIGWVGGGKWYNYTRTFPAGNYSVWAGLSHDPGDGLRGSLSQVTSDPTQPNQTTVALGSFNAPTSGAWGTDNVVQMKDGSGNVAVVSLSGLQTVRFNGDSGDYDYLVFVPAQLPLQFDTIANAAGSGNVTMTWSQAATLQHASALTGSPSDWADVVPQPSGNSHTVSSSSAAHGYYRLKQ